MSNCEFCGIRTPDFLERYWFGEVRAKQRNANWWVCPKCSSVRGPDHTTPKNGGEGAENPQAEFVHNKLTFPSGAVITFGHCERGENIYKYDSDGYNYMVDTMGEEDKDEAKTHSPIQKN